VVRFYGILKSLEVFQMLIFKISLLCPFLLLSPDVSAVRTARELWWMRELLFPAGIIINIALNVHLNGLTIGSFLTQF
jgi:hypothetical protein